MAKVKCKVCGKYTEEEQRYCLYCSTKLGSGTSSNINVNTENARENGYDKQIEREIKGGVRDHSYIDRSGDEKSPKKKKKVNGVAIFVIVLTIFRVLINIADSDSYDSYDYSDYDYSEAVVESIEYDVYSEDSIATVEETSPYKELFPLSELDDKDNMVFVNESTEDYLSIQGEINVSELGEMDGYYDSEIWFYDYYGNYFIVPIDISVHEGHQDYEYSAFENNDYLIKTEKGDFYFNQEKFSYERYENYFVDQSTVVPISLSYSTYKLYGDTYINVEIGTNYGEGQTVYLTGEFKLSE